MADTMIPAHVDDITVEWLNEVLSEEFDEVEAISVEHFGRSCRCTPISGATWPSSKR